MELIAQQEKLVDRIQRALLDAPQDGLLDLRDSVQMLAIAVDKLVSLRQTPERANG